MLTEETKLKELRAAIQRAYTELNNRAKTVTGAVGVAFCNAKLEAWAFDMQNIDRLLKGEENAMATIDEKLVTQVIKLSDIPFKRRESPLKDKVLEVIGMLEEDLKSEKVIAKREGRDPEPVVRKWVSPRVTYNNMSGLLSRMKSEKIIDAKRVKLRTAGKEIYLQLNVD